MLIVNHALAELAPLTDEELVVRVVAGDTAVFELLMRRHNQRLYRVARSVVRSDLEAEDVVQETYVRAYAHLSLFEGRSTVATWLTRIAFHEALRRCRRHKARRMTEARAAREALVMLDDDHEGLQGGGETTTMLTEALDALPMKARTVVVLRLIQGLSTRETAACLRLSETTVKVSLHRGKRMLGARLGPRIAEELRGEYSFGADRCDRVVQTVFRRIGPQATEHSSHPPDEPGVSQGAQ